MAGTVLQAAAASYSRVHDVAAAARFRRWPPQHHHRDHHNRRRHLHLSAKVVAASASAASKNDVVTTGGGLTVTTFNVLAPCYRRIKQPDGEVAMESTFPEIALERHTRIVDMLSDFASSVVCIQEFWHASPEISQLYERSLSKAGYATYVTPRTGNRPDGLLTAVKKRDFDVVERRDILFNDCGDRVATLLHLRHRHEGSGASLGDVLMVNTHLLFPHNSNSTLIRLRESFKILEYLFEYQEKMVGEVVEGGKKSRRLPVVMCGDFNGSIRGSVGRFLQSQGFESAFEVSLGNRGGSQQRQQPRKSPSSSSSSSRWISHLNHHGECVGVDHVWVLNPSKQYVQTGSGAPPPSWKTAIYAMIQAKMLEKGLVDNDKAFAFFDVDSDLGITRDEFEMAVRMLDLTGEGTPGLVSSEIQTLYDDCDVDQDGLVDFNEFVRKLDVESMERAYRAVCMSQDIKEGPWDVVGDLMAASASPNVLAGFTFMLLLKNGVDAHTYTAVDEDGDKDEDNRVDAGGAVIDRLFIEGGDDDDGGVGVGGVAMMYTAGGPPPAGRIATGLGDLAVESAALPAGMEAGEWPEDFDVSDHGPLTAVLVPRRASGAA